MSSRSWTGSPKQEMAKYIRQMAEASLFPLTFEQEPLNGRQSIWGTLCPFVQPPFRTSCLISCLPSWICPPSRGSVRLRSCPPPTPRAEHTPQSHGRIEDLPRPPGIDTKSRQTWPCANRKQRSHIWLMWLRLAEPIEVKRFREGFSEKVLRRLEVLGHVLNVKI